MKMKLTFVILLCVFLLILTGCQIEDNISENKLTETIENTYRTAQAVSFTVEHPYSWVREFVSLEAEDQSVISQGIDTDKPYMIISSLESSVPNTKILFAVNNLSISELTFQEYLEYVEDAIDNNFELINKNVTTNSAVYEYTYGYKDQTVYEMKKFIYKKGLLLTAVATTNYQLEDAYKPKFKRILSSIELRD